MQRILALLVIAFAPLVAPATSDAQSTADDEFRANFQTIVDDLNDNSFSAFLGAIDNKDFLGRVLAARVVEEEASQALAASFEDSIQTMFTGAFPRPRSQAEAGDIIGTVISFEAGGGQARAIVRYESKGYRYSFHAYELLRGRGDRVRIVDWFDYYQGGWFSEEVADSLVRAMPGKRSVAGVLETGSPSDAQLFQVGELLKAVRDGNPQRYFQIYDGLEEALRAEPFVVRLNYGYSTLLGDPRRLAAAVADMTARLPGDARTSLSLADYYISRRRFEDAIGALDTFEAALGMRDGATESLKATAAAALGEFERAEAYARSATDAEPTLELAWWTLLRARTAAEDYAGATEALTVLEDRFGHLLIPDKLRRDRFLKVLIHQDAYKAWREERDAT
ncbi:MAG: hypothetical protein KJP17_02075 [Gammaproteobacteria bacterium]|nr:hypothetical protein [Gammaproteobacteria bacterium]